MLAKTRVPTIKRNLLFKKYKKVAFNKKYSLDFYCNFLLIIVIYVWDSIMKLTTLKPSNIAVSQQNKMQVLEF